MGERGEKDIFHQTTNSWHFFSVHVIRSMRDDVCEEGWTVLNPRDIRSSFLTLFYVRLKTIKK